MTYELISNLLEKYWEGETSLSEEKALKTYFNGDTVDERLIRYQPLFVAIQVEQIKAMPASAPTLRITHRKANLWYYAAAASIIGLMSVGTWWYMSHQNTGQTLANEQPNLYQDTYEDPEKAAAEIKKALALVSSKMRKSRVEASKGLRKVEEVDKYFPKPKTSKLQ